MNVYAYCLSDEIADDLAQTLSGIGGAKARLVWRERIAAVVSDFDGDAAAVTRENVLAHERVVGGVLARVTPLPFRFGTVVGEERLAGYVSSQADALRAQLERVRGCVEMSVKVIWKEDVSEGESSPRKQPLGSSHSPPPNNQPRPDQSPIDQSRLDQSTPHRQPLGRAASGAGTAFLMAKRREAAGDEARDARAREIAGWLEGALAGAVRDSRIEANPRGALVVSAAYLVERERLEAYRELLRLARDERPDLHFLTSGAWSPYSFTNTRA
ncbi:MAG: GvpL/GvpF family gas vesicle protein [Acidobacteriota bacterium]|nr:GvpL/GvpF family gas vesicle protein [Acidobacteriota bacterium]